MLTLEEACAAVEAAEDAISGCEDSDELDRISFICLSNS